MVDTAFPSILAGARLALDWIGPGEADLLAERLAA
jgi:hypothetical protein